MLSAGRLSRFMLPENPTSLWSQWGSRQVLHHPAIMLPVKLEYSPQLLKRNKIRGLILNIMEVVSFFPSCAWMQRSCRSTLLIFSVVVEMVDHPRACGGEDSPIVMRQTEKQTEQQLEEGENSSDWRRREETRNTQRRAGARREGRQVSADVGGTLAATCAITYTGKLWTI